MTPEDEVTTREWLSLSPDEDVVHARHPSIWPYMPQILTELAASVAGIGIIIFARDLHEYAIHAGLAMFVLGIVAAGLTEYKRRHEWYVLTNQGVYKKRGWISYSTRSARYDNIQDKTTHIDIIGRILGFGDVKVTTSGTATQEFLLTDSQSPNTYLNIIDERVSKAHERQYTNDDSDDTPPENDEQKSK